MTTEIDQAMANVQSAEATLNADKQTVEAIQAAIDTATAPLAAAQTAVANDIAAFNGAIDTAVGALQAAKIV